MAGQPDLQANLDHDLLNVEAAILRRDWKAATVIGGAAIEAILLWAVAAALARSPEDVASVRSAARAGSADPEDWVLGQLIPAATYIGVLVVDADSDDAAALGQVRRYRNLIHPGRAQRLEFSCGKDTAHFALAGLHLACRRVKAWADRVGVGR